MALPLQVVELGAKALMGGLEAIEEALLSLDEAIPSAQESLLWLEKQVLAVANGIEKLEVTLGKALDKVADNPVAETLKDFSSMVLDALPFGLGDKIRGVLDGLVELVTSVDDLVAGINTQLLQPMREQWFSAEEGKGLTAAVVDPLVEHILDPLEAHLADLAALADTWQARMVEPTQQALEQRANVRKEIARYRNDHGMA
jgi:hypothetical protein